MNKWHFVTEIGFNSYKTKLAQMGDSYYPGI